MAHDKVYGICENKCIVPVYSKEKADENIGYLKGDNCIYLPSVANKFIYKSKTTGKLAIKLPCKTDDTKNHMIKFTVAINNMYGKDYGEYLISAQLWKGNWTNTKLAISSGKGDLSNLPISLGSEDGYYSITIGEDSTIWDYPYINIKDLSLWLYEPTYEQWSKDWDISIGIPTGTYTLANESPNSLLNLEEDVKDLQRGVQPIDKGGTGSNNGYDAFYNLMNDGSALEYNQDWVTGVHKDIKSYSFSAKKIGEFVFLFGSVEWNVTPKNEVAVCFTVPEEIIPYQSNIPLNVYGRIQADISIMMAINNNAEIVFVNSFNLDTSADIFFYAVYLA